MKLNATLASLLLATSASVSAQNAVIEISTPTLVQSYRGCTLTESHFQHSGRVATIIAECVGKVSQAPQAPGWVPPDLSGLPFLYQGRIRVSQTIESWLACEVLTYSNSPGGFGFVQVVCVN